MRLLFFTILLLYAGLSKSQQVNQAAREAEQLESTMNDEQAFLKYREALNKDPKDPYLLCKCSELSSRIGGRLTGDLPKQDEYYKAAGMYANAALQANPTYSEANFVYAVVMGSEAMKKGGKEKIDAVKAIKKYADLAIKYDPQNYKAWYVLGKWYYEISSLNFLERAAVKVFFGAFPPADINDAIKCFEKARSINPGFVLNYLSLAKAYKKKDEDHIAKKTLIEMCSLPDKMQDDDSLKQEGKELLKKWN